MTREQIIEILKNPHWFLNGKQFESDKVNDMEDFYNIRRLALVLAIQAEVEGMKAENQIRMLNNIPLIYGDREFNEKAEDLRQMAYAHDEQI